MVERRPGDRAQRHRQDARHQAQALIADGDIPKSLELRAKFPTGLISVMHLPGFGPKRARRLYDELGIDSLEALRAAAEQGRIRDLRGFGAKVEENLLKILDAGHDGTPAAARSCSSARARAGRADRRRAGARSRARSGWRSPARRAA